MNKIKKILSTVVLTTIILVSGCENNDSPMQAPQSTPVVTAKSPAANATNVALNKVVSVAFSEAMNTSTINTSTFTLKQGINPVLGTVVYSGTTATFTPSIALASGAVYTASISTGIKSAAGISLAASTT